MTAIIVSGTPGTGKTYVARKLSDKLKFKYVDVKRLLCKHGLNEKYDSKRKSYIIDEKRLAKVLGKLILDSNVGLVIDSHLSHFIDCDLVDLCVITKCKLKVLEKRLKKRRYNKQKIRENLDSEIFDICLNEAKEKGHDVLVVDTTRPISILKLEKLIKQRL